MGGQTSNRCRSWLSHRKIIEGEKALGAHSPEIANQKRAENWPNLKELLIVTEEYKHWNYTATLKLRHSPTKQKTTPKLHHQLKHANSEITKLKGTSA